MCVLVGDLEQGVHNLGHMPPTPHPPPERHGIILRGPNWKFLKNRKPRSVPKEPLKFSYKIRSLSVWLIPNIHDVQIMRLSVRLFTHLDFIVGYNARFEYHTALLLLSALRLSARWFPCVDFTVGYSAYFEYPHRIDIVGIKTVGTFVHTCGLYCRL